MLKLRLIGAFVLAITTFPQAATADFVANYSDWKALNDLGRAVYAQGFFDGSTKPVKGELISSAMSDGLRKCAKDIGLTAGMMSDAITKYYQDHTDMWGMPPFFGFNSEIVKGACLIHINEERNKLGLQPWKKN